MPSNDSAEPGRVVQIRAVIDRIEDGGWAVLLLGEDERQTIDFPVALLPANASGGDHLRFTVEIDSASRTAAEDRIRDLADRLDQRSGTPPGQKNFKL